MKTFLKCAIVGLSFCQAAAFASYININADAKGNLKNQLSFSAVLTSQSGTGLQSIGSLGVEKGGFSKDIPNDPHTYNALDGAYYVEVTVTTPGAISASTYCSVKPYLFSPTMEASETIISFDPSEGGTFAPHACQP